MNLQICFMNEDSETIEIDGSAVGGSDSAADIHPLAAAAAGDQNNLDATATLTPSATLVAQFSNSSIESGVDPCVDSCASGSLMKNSKSVGHFLHCLLPGAMKNRSLVKL